MGETMTDTVSGIPQEGAEAAPAADTAAQDIFLEGLEGEFPAGEDAEPAEQEQEGAPEVQKEESAATPEEKPEGEQQSPPAQAIQEGSPVLPQKSQELLYLEKMAAENGVSLQQYVQNMNNTLAQQEKFLHDRKAEEEFQRIYKELHAQYSGTSEDPLIRLYAQELAGKNLLAAEKAAAEDRLRRENYAREEAAKAQKARTEPWTRYFEKYPDKDVSKLPQELLLKVKSGMTPVEAQLELDMAALKQAQETKNRQAAVNQKAVGSLRGGAGQEAPDDFLAGLLS